MNKENIEGHIHKAVEVLNEKFGSEVIPSIYQGYISSFGVGIIQIGLLPTLLFFSKGNSEGSSDKKLIIAMIQRVLEEEYTQELFNYALEHRNQEAELTRLTEKIKEASVALKFAMRLFLLEKGGAS